jgi:DNA-binding PadR family transcriptional regulator
MQSASPLVRSRWGISETNRRVRLYELTAAGRKHLAANSDAWHRYAKAVSRVLSPA